MSIRKNVQYVQLDRHLRSIAATVRLSGTSDEAVAFDYIERVLKGFGFDINRYSAETLLGYPVRSRLTVLGQGGFEIACNGYALTPVTSDEGVEGDLVFVGSSLSTDYDSFDAQGKVVVCDGIAVEDAALAAARAGAIGQIFINPPNIHEMCISPVWGTPTPETAHFLPSVPAVGIALDDGERLRALAERASVRVNLMSQPHRAWTATTTLTADLPGQASDDFVLFSGHVDSWHYGAMDNGTANATQLEVGRLLAERRNDLKRGVRLAFWSGHSHGRYSGSTWYADTFWHDLHERCVCHVNVDSVGANGATILTGTSSMASTYGFARDVLRDTNGVKLEYHRKGRSSDQSFWGHGIPALFGAMSLRPGHGEDAGVAEIFGGVSLGWWWHTKYDTVDKINPSFFVRDAKIYAETLWRLCTAERIPFDPAAEADEMARHLARYNEIAGSALDLSGAAALAAEVADGIRAIRSAFLPASAANARTMVLCKCLIPVNYTEHGPFHHDLAVETAPMPGLREVERLARLDPASDDWHFLRAKLVRERNRVVHVLRAAGGVSALVSRWKAPV